MTRLLVTITHTIEVIATLAFVCSALPPPSHIAIGRRRSIIHKSITANPHMMNPSLSSNFQQDKMQSRKQTVTLQSPLDTFCEDSAKKTSKTNRVKVQNAARERPKMHKTKKRSRDMMESESSLVNSFPSPIENISPDTKLNEPMNFKSDQKDTKTLSSNTRNTNNIRTHSFQPIWAGTFDPNTKIQVHTLILGTHPSITSLGKNQYYGHAMNAFWWIAGDCLGFRRDSAISPSTGKPYVFSSQIRYGHEKIIPYEEQLQQITSHGFALWDILSSCERKGSLDSEIKNEIPNNIQEFCEIHHPTVRRIVLTNGSTQSTLFAKHFKTWWETGKLRPGDVASSSLSTKLSGIPMSNYKAFEKFRNIAKNFANASIECIVGPGVSPANASLSYEQKRMFYEKYCYEPGLMDYRRQNENSSLK